MTKKEMLEKLIKELTDDIRNITIHELPEGEEDNISEFELEFEFEVDGKLLIHTVGAYIGE